MVEMSRQRERHGSDYRSHAARAKQSKAKKGGKGKASRQARTSMEIKNQRQLVFTIFMTNV